MKEIQELSIHLDEVFEQTRITITNPDDQEYILVFKNPSNMNDIPSEKIPGKATATQFKDQIEKFYLDTLKSSIEVERTMFDASGQIISDDT